MEPEVSSRFKEDRLGFAATQGGLRDSWAEFPNMEYSQDTETMQLADLVDSPQRSRFTECKES
jgi:hypothetical protein